MPHPKVPNRLRAGLCAAALVLTAGASQAQTAPADLPFDGGVPRLLQWATDALQRHSSASAWSTFSGSVRADSCTSSYAFWECRDYLPSTDPSDPRNRCDQRVVGPDVASVRRDAESLGPMVDMTPATSHARAGFGANLGEAHAWNSRHWIERRVQGAWDGSIGEAWGDTKAGASAWSLYTEVLVPDRDGRIELQFSLRQHLGSAQPGVSGFPSQYYDGWASGELLVQAFDLEQIVEYDRPDSDYPVEGPLIVGQGSLPRGGDQGAGSSFVSVAFDALAGHRYSIVSELWVVAEMNGTANF